MFHPSDVSAVWFGGVTDKEELMRAIKLQCIKTHRQFKETRPTLWSIRYKLHLQSGCKWQLRASKRKRSGNFEITKPYKPRCKLDRSGNQITYKRATFYWCSCSESRNSYTPYKKLWDGKQKAIEQSYAALPKNFGALQKFNPGTIVEWCVSRSTDAKQVEFRRVFWAFAASIKEFAHFRHVISIDGTHLYGKYTGKMLIAMGVDGNNQILPLAFAIVENESYDSWNWFLSYIKSHVVKEREGICLISDRHLGILKVVNEHGSPWLEPRGFHRYCLRHFINNFNDKFRKSELKALAYPVRSQNQVRKFNSIMEEIGKWTLAHYGGRRYVLLTPNLSEIFNNVLKGVRFLPITACVQLTFYRLVHYFEVRCPLGSSARANGNAYTPQVVVKQVVLMSKASAHSLRSFNREKFIFDVCVKLSLNSWQYVHKCYSIADYCSTWASEFSSLPHEAYWPQSSSRQLLPNLELLRNKKGRPRSTRLQNGMDIKEGKMGTFVGFVGKVVIIGKNVPLSQGECRDIKVNRFSQ
uniref:MULE transposase domain-containing protein n=1 Tax=Lactuca sativa TaxID=4236 RepID=A0A9R1X475_LACSA|nr:hypothetical protein LSAT_V11C600319390 [Lactuca sativa]